MAKIEIAGTRVDAEGKTTVHVVLLEGAEGEQTALGEAFVNFNEGVSQGDIEMQITAAAENIANKARKARQERVRLQAMKWPEIEV